MPTATFRFYEELNDFLAPDQRKRDFQVEIPPAATVEDLLLLVGVPAAHVDLILVNGRPADFHCAVQNGDRVSVYPVFERLDVSSVARLPGRPLRNPKFIADAGLEELAAAMKSKGFDVTSQVPMSAREVVQLSIQEDRILITTNTEIFATHEVTHAIIVKGSSIDELLAHVEAQLNLSPSQNSSGVRERRE